MKKLITLALLLIMTPTLVFAFTSATLFKGEDRQAVKTQTEASNLFAKGYKLESNRNIGVASATGTVNIKWAQTQPFTLNGSGAMIGATTIVLKSMKNIDGSLLTMASFGSQGFGTIEPGVSNEEQITFTGITQNANGTATLTGVSRVLNIYPYTETSGLGATHSGGTKFVLSNTAGFYNTFANKENDEQINGTYTFKYLPKSTTTAPTSNDQLANKKYVDDTAVAGAPNATENVKGISQIPTRTDLANGTTNGSTGARLVIPNNLATSSFGIATTSLVMTGSNGLITSNLYQSNNNAWSGTNSFSATSSFNGVLNINGTSTASLVSGASSTVHFHPITMGNFTKTMTDGSGTGTTTITHNLGVTPRMIKIKGIVPKISGSPSGSISEGTYLSGNVQTLYYSFLVNSQNSNIDTTNIIHMFGTDDTASYQSALMSVSSTTITLSWTKTGLPVGTGTFIWEAYQ